MNEGQEYAYRQVRDKDDAVLQAIQDGEDDVQLITSSTTLSNSEVNYSFRKLEELGLIQVWKPDGMVERVVDGTKQVFEAPKQAELTHLGRGYFDWRESELGDRHRDLDEDEVVELLHEVKADIDGLRERVDRFEDRYESFRQQVVDRLFSGDR